MKVEHQEDVTMIELPSYPSLGPGPLLSTQQGEGKKKKKRKERERGPGTLHSMLQSDWPG